MQRAERQNDPVESLRLAMEGQQAQVWTALPGIVQSFDPEAMTVSVQPAVKGSVRDEQGRTSHQNMPLLVDVPVVFPCGGGFTLTHPIKGGDEALVVFSSRCIDGWWQGGDVSAPPSDRMHDLSDGIAIVGPRSQKGKLTPPVDTENVQLRSDDGKATVTMMPDYTIESKNPQTSVTLTPDGAVNIEASQQIELKAPQIIIEGNIITRGTGGTAGTFQVKGHMQLDGSITSTGDQVAGSVSQMHHLHIGDSGGITEEPVK